VKAGVPAAFINAALSPSQQETVLQRAEEGRYKLIYVAPERLSAPRFLRLMERSEVSFIAVDEAHCVSQWGHDFRSAYLEIKAFIDRLPKRPPVGAYTATATAEVREDIEHLLGLRSPETFISGFDRPNLYFEVRHPKGKFNELLKILDHHKEDSGIIYCATRKLVEEVCSRLTLMGVAATRYHAGLGDKERNTNQDDFLFDRKPVMVATNAFGMGIDKSNVSYVVHYNMPKNIESYYQEAGRAGRDGEKADCILLFEKRDIMINRYFIDHGFEQEGQDPVFREQILENEKKQLNRMVDYCTSSQCLRKMILSYFGEETEERCEYCGNCAAEFVTEDRTDDGYKILSCVDETHQRFGVNLIADILKGSRNKHIRELRLMNLPSYASLSDLRVADIREAVNHLIDNDYLYLTDDEYPIVGITEKGRDVLEGECGISVVKREEKEEEPSISLATYEKAKDETEELYELLRQKRKELAQKESVPAYVIFSNATLHDMSVKKPQNDSEFLEISGVGQVKYQRYGHYFLNVIREFFGEAPLARDEYSITDEADVLPAETELPCEEDVTEPEPIVPAWSEEDDGKLMIFLIDDVGIEIMAAYFGKTPDEIFQRLKDLGMIRKPVM
ncbi:MAG: RecQ family ATP-dependent DNA helicase, partial [Firmicutes bacterium]|nr:RecQ family ATP-dependent DNA helicase [Bacillota bacterium]